LSRDVPERLSGGPAAVVQGARQEAVL
jgi:hypothetical protein